MFKRFKTNNYGIYNTVFHTQNTDNIRNRLKEVGYKMLSPIEYDNLECSDNWVNDIKSLNDCNGINCGFNEELFLAIAALRDDSNYMQWFITDSILSVSYSDSIGNDHYFIEPKGIMFFGMKIGIMQPLFQDVITRLP